MLFPLQEHTPTLAESLIFQLKKLLETRECSEWLRNLHQSIRNTISDAPSAAELFLTLPELGDIENSNFLKFYTGKSLKTHERTKKGQRTKVDTEDTKISEILNFRYLQAQEEL